MKLSFEKIVKLLIVAILFVVFLSSLASLLCGLYVILFLT